MSVHKVIYNIYIGDDDIASDLKKLQKLGITHIINTTHELDNYFPLHFHYLKLNLHDIDEDIIHTLNPSYNYIDRVIKRNPENKVLIHCYAGKSRSASIVIYFLMKKFGLTYKDAHNFLKSKRNIIKPNQSYMRQLKSLETKKR
jgi:protein-tyrosine phosphatase